MRGDMPSSDDNPPAAAPPPPESSPPRLRAWLELMRISNLPTVWSNVLVGFAVGLSAAPEATPVTAEWTARDWLTAAGIATAMSMMYVAGMILNDVADADLDGEQRPGRPIPSGRVSRRAAMIAAIALFAVALPLIWLVHPQGLPSAWLLLAAIALYDLIHKKLAISVVFMGLCRFLVVCVAAADASTEQFTTIALPLATILALYTIVITLIARGEHEQRMDQRKWLVPAMLIVVLAAPWLLPGLRDVPSAFNLAAAVLLLGWLGAATFYVFATPPRTIAAVLTLLSGMALVDAYFLSLLNSPIAAIVAVVCFVVTAWGHRRILGT